ncbi:MAG: CoA-binding protein, partial [Deltaproteobacteria bacterium]|nr:CoA-binding protein [Deltaproteobacteria bacterium]
MPASKELKNPFPFYVGSHSLHTLADKHTRVCVMNILGNESSVVTPVSHAYSGGNIVAGVHYGRSGHQLETSKGNIPVYGSVKEVINSGIEFDTGVIYLPPAAVNHAVSELCAHNELLEKIVILTEKISINDSKLIRYGCQLRKVDVFGGNCLGIANPWDHVRVGGALGGDKPEESLKKGSVAIYSNSGNFCTTISEYLKTSGFGISTILSSGKDVYIHFALAEFLYCAENDPRTKAIVVYIEPGGYYEKIALDWIAEGRFPFTKPIIACVTGRWKSNLTRACGHAGAMAGSGDDAQAKEAWFDQYFGVGLFNPAKPDVSERGVRISSIQDVPTAVSAVMKLIGEEPDFNPIGNLNLKPWFGNDQGINFSKNLSLQVVKAIEPYGQQIEVVSKLVGAQLSRESMRDKSGASMMNPATQVTELHGKPILELVDFPFAATCLFAITKEMPTKEQVPLINAISNYFVARGTRHIETAVKGRENGCTPNAYLAPEIMLQGTNPFFKELRTMSETLSELVFEDAGHDISVNDKLAQKLVKKDKLFGHNPADETEQKVADYLFALVKKTKQETIFTQFAQNYI